jgi:hypothetical protein
MSKANRNFIISYALLVGLPVLGLVGVLKTGRSLSAPISVDGTWRLQADAARLRALPCGKSLASPDIALAISQSGANFTLNLVSGPKAVASGVLEGTNFEASVVPSPANDVECTPGRELELVATVDPKANPRVLSGTISVSDCPSCSPVEFRAFRQSPPAVGTR